MQETSKGFSLKQSTHRKKSSFVTSLAKKVLVGNNIILVLSSEVYCENLTMAPSKELESLYRVKHCK